MVLNSYIIKCTDDFIKLSKINEEYNINTLIISSCFPNLNDYNIPNTINEIIFNYSIYVRSETKFPYIPKFIKKIEFYHFADIWSIEQLATYELESIIIYKGFNKSVEMLNNTLKKIDFGMDFNQPINNLPSSLEIIILGTSFNQSINNIPDTLKILSIHNELYNLDSIKILPKSLIKFQLKCYNVSEYDFKTNSYIIRNNTQQINFENITKKKYFLEIEKKEIHNQDYKFYTYYFYE
jgi:hypothetical protein